MKRVRIGGLTFDLDCVGDAAIEELFYRVELERLGFQFVDWRPIPVLGSN